MKISKSVFIAGMLTCGLGLIGLAAGGYFTYRNQKTLDAARQRVQGPTITTPTVIAEPKVITGKPSRLRIPSLNLDLLIADGIYNATTGEWTLSNDMVHYALMTVQPNDRQGNTLIYGHYRPGVFATLHTIRPGALVEVTTENGHVFTYEFTGSKVVQPTDMEILSYDGEPMLTLQTCTGAFMQDRQLFSFEFVAVKEGKKVSAAN